MLEKLNVSAPTVFAGALTFFLIGGLMTTAVPAITETSWLRPVSGEGQALSDKTTRGRAI